MSLLRMLVQELILTSKPDLFATAFYPLPLFAPTPVPDQIDIDLVRVLLQALQRIHLDVVL